MDGRKSTDREMRLIKVSIWLSIDRFHTLIKRFLVITVPFLDHQADSVPCTACRIQTDRQRSRPRSPLRADGGAVCGNQSHLPQSKSIGCFPTVVAVAVG